MEKSSMASKLISTSITRATRTFIATKGMTSTLTDIDDLRKAYLTIIDSPDWKKQMEDSANMIAKNLMNDLAINEIDNSQFTIAYMNKLYEFDSTIHKFITIGRKADCDITLMSLKTSRLNALIMPLPQFNICLVIDMGGLSGILLTKRTSNKPLCASIPNNRNIIILDWNEISILKFGSEKIAINPKECIICLSNPRNITFNCGHHTTCQRCTQKITECPICRAPKTTTQTNFELKTHIRSK